MSAIARLRIVLIVTVILSLGGCAAANAPDWTFPADAQPAASNAAMPAMSGMPGMADTTGAVRRGGTGRATLETTRSTSASSRAPSRWRRPDVSGQVRQRRRGPAQPDVRRRDEDRRRSGPDGQRVDRRAGRRDHLHVLRPGHAQAGMTGAIRSVRRSDARRRARRPAPPCRRRTPVPPRTPSSIPTAPAVMSGTVHDIEMPIIERDMTVAAGYVMHVWTFGGTVPGPTIRVHLGDTVRVHLTNTTTMSHSIDFHASQTAMNDQMVEIKPGATFTYTFRADYAGVWMYHCGTAPALEHIADGMFGMVIVEPRGGLPKVDQELAIVQNEWYFGGQGQIADYAKANSTNPAPDFVVFNGVANQYKDHPIQVQPGKRLRIFVLDVGPNEPSSFHIVGTIFDTVISEGVALERGNAGGWGSQAVDLSPAQAAIIELTVPESGMYTMVTHAFNFVGHGAVGALMAGDGNPPAH